MYTRKVHNEKSLGALSIRSLIFGSCLTSGFSSKAALPSSGIQIVSLAKKRIFTPIGERWAQSNLKLKRFRRPPLSGRQVCSRSMLRIQNQGEKPKTEPDSLAWWRTASHCPARHEPVSLQLPSMLLANLTIFPEKRGCVFRRNSLPRFPCQCVGNVMRCASCFA